MIVSVCSGADCLFADGVEICFPGQAAAQSSDGIFDAAFLPWRADIAEEGLDADLAGELMVQGELRARPWSSRCCAAVRG